MAGPIGLQQLARFQGLEWGDSANGDTHLWLEAGQVKWDGQTAPTYQITKAQATQGQAHLFSLNFSGISANYAGLICALDGATTTDTGTQDYTGKLRGTMGHVIVATSAGTIAATEGVAGVVLINTTAAGTMTYGFGTGGELIHTGPAGYTVTAFDGVRGQVELQGDGNIGSGYAVSGKASTYVGSTGTFTTLMCGVFGLAQHNTIATVAKAVGGQLYVDLTAAGTITGNTVGAQGYVQSASSATVSGNAYGVDAWIDWGSSTAITIAYAIEGQIKGSGAGTISQGECFHALAPGGTVPITTARGVRIANQGRAGVTTAEGLRIDNQTGATTNRAIVTTGGLHNFVVSADTALAWTLTDGTTTLYAIDTRITVANPVAHKFTGPVTTVVAAAGVTYSVVNIPAYTFGTTGATGITALNGISLNIAAPTISSAGASATTTASTVYISGAPINSGSGSITNAFALHVVGALRLESTVANGSVATALSSVGPTGAATTVQEWLKVVTANGTRYIPCF